MNIKLSWENSTGALTPCCTSDEVNSDGISLLSCLLMDDGGIPYLETIPWINEGIYKINSILRGEISSYSWDREAWGALITVDEVKVYSLHDEEYFQIVSVQEIKCALESWLEFIQSEPILGDKKNISL
jgi:hypothetical protein